MQIINKQLSASCGAKQHAAHLAVHEAEMMLPRLYVEISIHFFSEIWNWNWNQLYLLLIWWRKKYFFYSIKHNLRFKFLTKNPRPSKIICACLFQNCEGRRLWLGSRWKVRAFADKHSLHLQTLIPRVRREWNVLFTVCETNLVVKSLRGFDTMCYKTYAARTDRPDLEINRNNSIFDSY